MRMVVTNLLYRLYRINNYTLRTFIKRIICAIEGGQFHSKTLRRIFRNYHGVEIGMFTHGECFKPECAEPFTKIGRYCSIARGVRIININHPVEFKSTNNLFWHPMNIEKKDLVNWTPLIVGNDVWIGHGATILPGVGVINDGAVIGAGAVVNKSVPPYAVVVGNPARVVRYRFSKEVIDELLESKWWEKDMDELKANIGDFQQPYEKLFLERKQNKLQEPNNTQTQSEQETS